MIFIQEIRLFKVDTFLEIILVKSRARGANLKQKKKLRQSNFAFNSIFYEKFSRNLISRFAAF